MIRRSANGAPHVIPTHFAVDGDTLLVHLARPNKVWAAIEARPNVVMIVIDDSPACQRSGRGFGENRSSWPRPGKPAIRRSLIIA